MTHRQNKNIVRENLDGDQGYQGLSLPASGMESVVVVVGGRRSFFVETSIEGRHVRKDKVIFETELQREEAFD